MRKIVCEQCAIREDRCIVDLPPEQLDEFRKVGVPAIYKPRQVVFHEGMPSNGLYLLCHGTVKLYQSDRFGRDFILGIAEPGDVLGELPLDAAEPYSTSAEALCEAQISYLPRERLVAFIEEHPMIGVRLIASLSKALAAARRKARDLALMSAENRLAALLVELAEAGGNGAATGVAPRITLDYSRREIAEMIGVSSETAIRLLGRLKRRGVITADKREVVIADLEKLTRLAHQHDIEAS